MFRETVFVIQTPEHVQQCQLLTRQPSQSRLFCRRRKWWWILSPANRK
jgi:hypothetical protein